MFFRLLLWGITTILSIGPIVSQDISSIQPTTVWRDFSHKIVHVDLNVTVAPASNASIAISVDRILRFDRPPNPGSQSRCKGMGGKIVRGWGMQEAYAFSCCTRQTPTLHVCPAPPTGEIDIVHAILYRDSRPVYMAVVDGTEREWVKTEFTVDFVDLNPSESIIRIGLAGSTIFFVILGAIYMFVGNVHELSNHKPLLCIVFHVFITLMLIAGKILTVNAIQTEDTHPYSRAGMVHLLIQTMFSLLMVYTPSDGTYSNDQRLNVDKDRCMGKLSVVAGHPRTKWIAVHVFALSSYVNVLSVVTIINILWDRFDATFDVLFAVAIWYVICIIIYTVAFVTAIYEIHAPLKINSKNIVIGKRKGVADIRKKDILGMFNPSTKKITDTIDFKRGTVVAVVPFHGGSCAVACIPIGTLEMEKIVPNPSLTVRTRGTFCTTKEKIQLPPPIKASCIPMYTVDPYNNLVQIGCLKRTADSRQGAYTIHVYHSYALRFFKLVLRMAPMYDDSDGKYKLNAVENLRSKAQSMCSTATCRGQPLFGLVYIFMFAVVSCVSLGYIAGGIVCLDSAWWIYLVDILLLFTMGVFTLNVATKRSMRVVADKSHHRSSNTMQAHQGSTLPEVFREESIRLQLIAPQNSIEFKRTPIVQMVFQQSSTVLQLPWPAYCPSMHFLRLVRTTHGSWACDHGGCPLQNGAPIWFCETCNWCQCVQCAPVACVSQKGGVCTVKVANAAVTTSCNDAWSVRIL